MTINNITFDRSGIPDHVYDDVQKLRNTIDANTLRVESGPNDAWTIRISDDTNRKEFDSVKKLVNDAVSSNDVHYSYERSTSRDWLIQVRYDA